MNRRERSRQEKEAQGATKEASKGGKAANPGFRG